jgi:transketolase
VLGAAAGVAKGAYILRDEDDPEAVIVATGSEVWVALEAADLLDFPVRVVSMPSWELFEQQDEDYQDDVLPEDLPTVSVEAAISMGWERWADEHVSIERFGASAPGAEVLQKFGFTPSHVAQVVRDLLDDLDQED